MKNRIILAVSALLICLGSQATYKPGYYDAMDGKKKEALKAAVKSCAASHTKLDYTNLPNHWYHTDIYPDLYNGQKRWWEMYSNEVYLIRNNQTGLESFRDNKMQREHSVPKSWWGGSDATPAYTDIFNLYPSDGPANQAKSNYPLGPVGSSPSFNNGVTKVGRPAAGYGGNSGNVFEPADEYKGDFARAYFYVFTIYNDLDWTATSMASKNAWPTLKPWAYELLLQWAREDRVSQKEIERNDAVEIQQGNRNPFVDFPELAEYIWGTRTTETFYIKDQTGVIVTPPITDDPELTSPVSGESLDFSQVAVGSAVTMPLLVDGSNLTSALSLRITGENKELFSTEGSSIPASSVNQEGGFRLNIVYKPTSVGRHTARLVLYDGGFIDGRQFIVELVGEAFPVPELTAPVANPASNITQDSYMASWNQTPEVVDYYVVTRTRYLESGPVTVTVDTPELYYTFEDRDPQIEESYYVQSSRLGYLSPKSNTVTVSAGTSVTGIDSSSTMLWGLDSDGFVILRESGAEDVAVYDMAGGMVFRTDYLSYGEKVTLPRGFYLVKARNILCPLKIVIR